MKKIIIVLVAILLGNVFLNFFLINNQKSQVGQIENLYANNLGLNHDLEALKASMIDSWHVEGALLNADSIYTEDGEKFNVKNLDIMSPILIFRFSKVDCSDCVVKQIGLIKRMIRNDQIRYVMICDYSNKRNLGIFKRTNAISDHVYDCSKLFVNENRTPFFCIYDKGRISNVFFRMMIFQL